MCSAWCVVREKKRARPDRFTPHAPRPTPHAPRPTPHAPRHFTDSPIHSKYRLFPAVTDSTTNSGVS